MCNCKRSPGIPTRTMTMPYAIKQILNYTHSVYSNPVYFTLDSRLHTPPNHWPSCALNTSNSAPQPVQPDTSRFKPSELVGSGSSGYAVFHARSSFETHHEGGGSSYSSSSLEVLQASASSTLSLSSWDDSKHSEIAFLQHSGTSSKSSPTGGPERSGSDSDMGPAAESRESRVQSRGSAQILLYSIGVWI